MKIDKNVVNNHNYIRFLKNEKNNFLYLKYLYEPNVRNAVELNEAYKKYERQLIVRSYLKKAINFEAKKFDQKIRNNEKQNTPIDQTEEDGKKLIDMLIDAESERIYDELWNTKLEETFEDIKLYQAVINLTSKQRKILYLLYIRELSEKEIARHMSVTQQAVSKVHRKAINKLKEVMS
ncbi:sigma-70 family RNA polymerase sigma factor (plasmid) [Ureibacillus chungkukjangi]|uniref:sigma-70 family RNA polymerase sigma factor n=1 Tax=Ureibacillus chungkukjangi TaxID=1202712 RepID=UPI000D3579C4|nr:sigma-70 family RNA polymerase sigma factor [Ureibacillus chungkukjangi]